MTIKTGKGRLGGQDVGRRLYDSVKFDADLLVEILLGHLVPGGAARSGQRVVDHPLTGLCLLGDGFLHGASGQLRLSQYIAKTLFTQYGQEDFVVLVVLIRSGGLEVSEGGVWL